MDVLQKARELGEALQSSEEFKAMEIARADYETDSTAQALTAEYNEIHAKLTEELRREDIKPMDMIKIRQQMSRESAKLSDNEIIKKYLDSKKAAENLLSKVNSIIHFYVTGEEEDENSSCGGGCSGCSGCH